MIGEMNSAEPRLVLISESDAGAGCAEPVMKGAPGDRGHDEPLNGMNERNPRRKAARLPLWWLSLATS